MIIRLGKLVIAWDTSEEKDADKYWSCTRKIKFSQASAERGAEKMNKKKLAKGSEKVLEAYECRYCDGWHIGRIV